MADLVWIITGMVLFGAMTAGAIRLWINKKREKIRLDLLGDTKVQSDED